MTLRRAALANGVAHYRNMPVFLEGGFKVTPATLDPAPIPETLHSRRCWRYVGKDKPLTILDHNIFGTGCLLLSLLQELPRSRQARNRYQQRLP